MRREGRAAAFERAIGPEPARARNGCARVFDVGLLGQARARSVVLRFASALRVQARAVPGGGSP